MTVFFCAECRLLLFAVGTEPPSPLRRFTGMTATDEGGREGRAGEEVGEHRDGLVSLEDLDGIETFKKKKHVRDLRERHAGFGSRADRTVILRRFQATAFLVFFK